MLKQIIKQSFIELNLKDILATMSQPSPLMHETLPAAEHVRQCEDDNCTLPAVVEITYFDEDRDAYNGNYCDPHATQRENELSNDRQAYRVEILQ